jgi:hypothetical protein
MKISKRVSIILLLLFLGCLAVFATPYLDLQMGLRRISARTGISPSIDALKLHLNSILLIGTPRDEIEKRLSELGNIQVIHSGEYCDQAVLEIGYWPLNELVFFLCYDKNLRLRSVRFQES